MTAFHRKQELQLLYPSTYVFVWVVNLKNRKIAFNTIALRDHEYIENNTLLSNYFRLTATIKNDMTATSNTKLFLKQRDIN